MFSWLTYLLGTTFTVQHSRCGVSRVFSLIPICAYISRSETQLTVSVIAGLVVTQYKNFSSTDASSSTSRLCGFSFALHGDAKWFFLPHAPHTRPHAAQLEIPLRCFLPQKTHGLSLEGTHVFPVGMLVCFPACSLWLMWFCFLCFLFSSLHFMDILCSSLVHIFETLSLLAISMHFCSVNLPWHNKRLRVPPSRGPRTIRSRIKDVVFTACAEITRLCKCS